MLEQIIKHANIGDTEVSFIGKYNDEDVSVVSNNARIPFSYTKTNFGIRVQFVPLKNNADITVSFATKGA